MISLQTSSQKQTSSSHGLQKTTFFWQELLEHWFLWLDAASLLWNALVQVFWVLLVQCWKWQIFSSSLYGQPFSVLTGILTQWYVHLVFLCVDLVSVSCCVLQSSQHIFSQVPWEVHMVVYMKPYSLFYSNIEQNCFQLIIATQTPRKQTQTPTVIISEPKVPAGRGTHLPGTTNDPKPKC